MGTLHRLWENWHIIVFKKFAAKTNWFVGPRLKDDLGSFIHAPGCFLLVNAEFSVFMGFAALAHAKIQPPI
jgi:hypothetical protein